MKEQSPTNSSSPHISFHTEQSKRLSSEGSFSKKVYFLSKKLSPSRIDSNTIDVVDVENIKTKRKAKSRNNIFDLTDDNKYQSEYSIMDDSVNFSLSDSPSKHSIALHKLLNRNTPSASPGKSFTLPIITESKYNFRPLMGVDRQKVKKYENHQKDPKYLLDSATVNLRNIRKMKQYKKIWQNESSLREQKSLLDHSSEKAEKIVQKHNKDVLVRKETTNFEIILRNRHIEQQNRIGSIKGIPVKQIKGLKGRGNTLGSLFQKMFCVEEVYKSHA